MPTLAHTPEQIEQTVARRQGVRGVTVLAEVAAAPAESPLWAGALLGAARAGAEFAGRCPDDYLLGVEMIREGYLLHRGRSRLFRQDDPELALLTGDHLFAAGLVEICRTGDLSAVASLADLIPLRYAAASTRAAATTTAVGRHLAGRWPTSVGARSGSGTVPGAGRGDPRARRPSRTGGGEHGSEPRNRSPPDLGRPRPTHGNHSPTPAATAVGTVADGRDEPSSCVHALRPCSCRNSTALASSRAGSLAAVVVPEPPSPRRRRAGGSVHALRLSSFAAACESARTPAAPRPPGALPGGARRADAAGHLHERAGAARGQAPRRCGRRRTPPAAAAQVGRHRIVVGRDQVTAAEPALRGHGVHGQVERACLGDGLASRPGRSGRPPCRGRERREAVSSEWATPVACPAALASGARRPRGRGCARRRRRRAASRGAASEVGGGSAGGGGSGAASAGAGAARDRRGGAGRCRSRPAPARGRPACRSRSTHAALKPPKPAITESGNVWILVLYDWTLPL